MGFVETVKEKTKKGWEYVKDHKVEIGLTVVTVSSTIGLIILGKKLHSLDTKHKDLDIDWDKIFRSSVDTYSKNFSPEIAENMRIIDDQIFTDLAPEIEIYVLDNGIEHAISERTYKLEPTLNKLVRVTVEAIHGD